jgi:FkbM family methyltransferase
MKTLFDYTALLQLFSSKGSLISKADRANAARNWPQAEALYKKALGLDESLAHIWVQYGHSLKEQGRLPDAETAYRQAVRLDPKGADGALQLGHCLKMQGRIDEAIKCYSQALQVNPGLQEALPELLSTWNGAAVEAKSNIGSDALFNLFYGLEWDQNFETHFQNFGIDRSDCTLTQIRRMIGCLDKQTYPTPVTIRFSADDLRIVNVGSFQLVLDKADLAVSTSISFDKTYEKHVRSFTELFLKPGMYAIDIGANIGFYSMLFASIVGPSGKVFAFEPNTENCRLVLLSKNLNRFDQLQLFAFALTNFTGTVFFSPHIGSNGGLLPTISDTLSNPNCLVVPCTRLDTVIDEKVDLIKADIEGAEYLALSGGESLIRRHRPVIISEFSLEMLSRVSNISGKDYLQWMMADSYRAFVLERDNTGITEIEDIDRLLSNWGDFCKIEDLAFIPEEKGPGLGL